MADYTLYYWSVPFRGQFVRAALAFAGKDWDEVGDEAISRLMQGPVAELPIPFMGPPLLIDRKADFPIAEMPAIMLYLGETLKLLPATAGQRALTLKIITDANDVIDEMTLQGGRDMWTEQRWTEFTPRLKKWMSIWEETGRRHGLTAQSGFMLGGEKPGMADIVTATLWSTMTARFSRIATLLDETAPLTAALSRRVSALPALRALDQLSHERYGDAYAGGQIGTSMAKILDR